MSETLKAEDLMVGNWLERTAGIMQVTGITEEGIWFADGDIEDFKYPRPIELTPKLLEQAGFKSFKVDNQEGFIYNNTPIYCYFDGVQFVFKYGIDSDLCFAACEYLHELQNLIKVLTGKELEITF